MVNPYWVVPEGITRREIIPKVIKNPTYLKNQNMEMLRGYGRDMQIVNPANIDWSTVSTRNFPYRFRQRPGSRNALGRIKFKFPNRLGATLILTLETFSVSIQGHDFTR